MIFIFNDMFIKLRKLKEELKLVNNGTTVARHLLTAVGRAVNFQTLLMISKKCLNILKEVAYLYRLMEVTGSQSFTESC